MIHLALQEVTAGIAANGITGYFTRIGAPILAPPSQSYAVPAAIGAAAANLCKHLYPAQKNLIDTEMARFGKTLASGFSGPQINEGEDYGRAVAAAMIALRKDDKSKADDTYSYAAAPGKHRPDPHHPGQQSLGAHWGKVTPFAIAGPAAVNINPPALTPPPTRLPTIKSSISGVIPRPFARRSKP